MPGKYSYNAVLSDFSSQGLIPLPNDKQIDYQRVADAPKPSNRSRSHSALKGSAAPFNSAASARRVVIQDSDSNDGAILPPRHARVSTPTSRKTPRTPNTASTPQRQAGSKHGESHKHARIEKPLPTTATPSTPEPRRAGGVRAFIAARHQQEAGAESHPDSTIPEISLHDFLDSAPRSPQKLKRQPRDAHFMPRKHSDSLRNHELSVKEFLNLVPSPSPISGANSPTESRNSPVSPGERRSPLVSRLPKGIELPARQTRTETDLQTKRKQQRSSGSDGRPRSPAQKRNVWTPTVNSGPVPARESMPKSPAAPPHQGKKLDSEKHRSVTLTKKIPPREHFGKDYSLDFDGITDRETSFFPDVAPLTSSNTRLRRVSSMKSSVRRSETPHSMKSVQPAAPQRSRLDPGRQGTAKQAVNVAASPPITPQESTFYTDDQPSPARDSVTTYERPTQSPRPTKAQMRQRRSGSWSLPPIMKSDSTSDGFSNMFKDKDKVGRSILIFTSDEEDIEQDEDDALDEDDLPTPRVQKIQEDVRFQSSEWGMISAGKQFKPGSKDADNMSDLSAVYPPDIGRNHGGDDYGSPLALTLQSMQHGGELGAVYKPSPGRFTFRKSVNATELLWRLGLRKSDTASDRESTKASTTSGRSKRKDRPGYHPSSSSRGRLPNES